MNRRLHYHHLLNQEARAVRLRLTVGMLLVALLTSCAAAFHSDALAHAGSFGGLVVSLRWLWMDV